MFNFVDLFAGIGGFHIACQRNGGMCVGACEINADAQKLYTENYGISPHDDIRTMKVLDNVDMLCAGFPCQSHSTLGERLGFDDNRGKLFTHLKNYIKEVQPTAFLLENVKGLLSSNEGKNFKIILSSLKKLGYKVSWTILDSKNFGLPQHRERVFIVGHKNKTFDFSTLLKQSNTKVLNDFLDKTVSGDLKCDIFKPENLLNVPIKTRMGFVLRAKLSNFTNRKLFSSNGIIGTIATNSPPPIYDERFNMVRHLSKNELKKCQGFPSTFKFPNKCSRTFVVHYIGNAVSVNVVEEIVKEMMLQKLIVPNA